jgi:multidrug efflux pump subunit AcrA (membrane-fusion protein)
MLSPLSKEKRLVRLPTSILPTLLSLTIVSAAFAEEPASQPSKELVTVKRGTIAAVVRRTGISSPLRALEVKIRPKAYQGDLLVSAAAAHGARVKKGEPILELDATQIQKQIATAENELATAHANQAKADADVQLGESADALAMQMAQAELSNAEAG